MIGWGLVGADYSTPLVLSTPNWVLDPYALQLGSL